MPISNPTVGPYPSIEDVMQRTRILINDTQAGAFSTVGEGRVFTDQWTPSINILNLALQKLQRDLELAGLPTTRELTYNIGTNLTLVLTAAAAASGQTTTYTGTITGGATNAFVGKYFNITGFTNAGNNVANALCVASTALALTLINPDGVAETNGAQAVSGGLPVVNGPLGSATADPGVVVYLGYNGFWDGTVLHTSPTLPPDLLYPVKIRARISGSGNPFRELHEFPSGLYSCNQSAIGLGGWEWFNDRLNMNGSLVAMDMELRYQGGISPFSVNLNPDIWASTYVPFADSGDALAYQMTIVFVGPRLPQQAQAILQGLKEDYSNIVAQLAARWLRPPVQGAVAQLRKG